MKLNIFNIIILSSVIHGFIFTCVVFFNKKYKSKASKYIGLVVLFLSLSNFQYWIINIGLITKTSFLKFIFIPWQWLIMPMFYLFLWKYLYQQDLQKKRCYILISPFVIICALLLIQIIVALNSNYIIPGHFERGLFLYLDYASFIFNLIVLFLVYKEIRIYESKYEQTGFGVKNQTSWLLRLLYIGFIICAVWLASLSVTTYYNENAHFLFYVTWLSISFFIYWLGYAAIVQLNVSKQRKNIREKKEIQMIIKNKKRRKQNSVFSKFESLIVTKELYLNPTIKLFHVAEIMGVTSNYLSKILNEENATNFNDYINEYRIKRAKELLLNKEFAQYTNIAIGLESGFNSKSTFFKAFKKHVHMTPSEYKKHTIINNES